MTTTLRESLVVARAVGNSTHFLTKKYLETFFQGSKVETWTLTVDLISHSQVDVHLDPATEEIETYK